MLSVLSHPLLNKVSLILKKDHLYPVRTFCSWELVASSTNTFSVSAVLIMTSKMTLWQLVHNLRVQQGSKVTAEFLLMQDGLVAEAQSPCGATLLRPEDDADGVREEDTFNRHKGNHLFGFHRWRTHKAFFCRQGLVSRC